MADKEGPPNLLTEAFRRTAEALSGSSSYTLIGGLAVAFHGLARATRDIDLLLSTPRIALPALLEKFRERGFGFSMETVLRELGEDHLSRIDYAGVPVDFLEATIPFFRGVVERAREEDIQGVRMRIASPEDLVALKMIAGREDDLRDIRGILATQGDALDLGHIRLAIAECCEEGRAEVFERLLAERDP